VADPGFVKREEPQPEPRDELEQMGDTARVIKQAFQHWDLDRSGTISKEELEQVMRSICPMSEDEIDMLMQEADANGDGVIEYSEFVDWLTKPAKQSYGRAILDYSQILKPLFQVYDRKGTGSIGFEDFEECHAILQNSLKIHPRKDGSPCMDPLALQMDAKEAFRQLDTSEDGSISYIEFVAWMRDHLDTQGLDAGELAGFTSKLAKILGGIFHLNKLASEDPSGCLGSDEEALLGRLVENLAKATEEFQGAGAELPEELRPKKQSIWTAPPVGMSIQRLKGQHMKLFPVSARSVESVELDVLCVPTPDGAETPEKRLWIAEVVRSVLCTDGKRSVECPTHYVYDRESFRWVQTGSSREYEQALELLSPELTVFCILKTQADFGIKIGWEGLQKGLKCAVDMDLITREQRDTFDGHIEDQVMGAVKEELANSGETPNPRRLKARLQEALEKKFTVKPLEVMAMLTKLEIVKPSPLWKSMSGGSLDEP